jgi:hypothetical protein
MDSFGEVGGVYGGKGTVYIKGMGGQIFGHTPEKRFWFSNISKLKNFQNYFSGSKDFIYFSPL